MSSNITQDTEQLIIKLLKKLERKGKNIQGFLWQLMDQFENEQFDEKKNESEANNNNNITLLYDATATNVCKVGHAIFENSQKHLSIKPCIQCEHKNNNIHSKMERNHKQILTFLNSYNINQIPFGPNQQQKKYVNNVNAKKWPLHSAAVQGDTVRIKQLCKNKNIDIDQKMTDYDDTTPISYASQYGQLQSVIELIKNGANAIPPPDAANETPYKCAVNYKHKSIVVFFKQYIKYLYDFNIDNKTNLECFECYSYDLHFNRHKMDGTISNYVYCANCAVENVKKIQQKREINLIIENRIIKTIRENPSISVDTLCQMKDVKSLHSILKEVMVSGQKHGFWLWLLDIDNFKVVNSHLTHAIADTKIQALGQVLKQLEPMRWKQWKKIGFYGIHAIYAFRQGGDEFALVVECGYGYKDVLQKLYKRITNDINKIQLGKTIKLDNGNTMERITVSIGVCHGQGIDNYQQMLKRADEAAETVKKGGKNGIAIYYQPYNKIYKDFNHIAQ